MLRFFCALGVTLPQQLHRKSPAPVEEDEEEEEEEEGKEEQDDDDEEQTRAASLFVER